MNRYYIKTYLSPRGCGGLIGDKVLEVFCLFWDHKKKVHNFVTIKHIHDYCKGDTSHFGTPVVFENEDQEKEFLAYHPDAKCMRSYYKYGHFYGCNPYGINEDKLPFELRRGRWCWKKPLTVA